MRLAIEIIAALFAVFGVYCATRLAAQKIFGTENIILAVTLKDKNDAIDAEMLIREALGSFLVTSSCRVAVLLTEELATDTDLMSAIRKYGAEYYIVDMK